MDFMPQTKRGNKSKRRGSSVDPLRKVVYISSPMKVKISASKFRTLVQELTGRDSDISRFMDANTTTTTISTESHEGFEILSQMNSVSKSHNHDKLIDHHPSQSISFPVDPPRDSPTSSDSLLEQPPTFDEAFITEQYYKGLLASDLFCDDSSPLDVLGSYYAL